MGRARYRLGLSIAVRTAESPQQLVGYVRVAGGVIYRPRTVSPPPSFRRSRLPEERGCSLLFRPLNEIGIHPDILEWSKRLGLVTRRRSSRCSPSRTDRRSWSSRRW